MEKLLKIRVEKETIAIRREEERIESPKDSILFYDKIRLINNLRSLYV